MADTVTTVQIDPSDLGNPRIVQVARQPLAPGEVRFRVERFALTANNITYAKAGSFLGYMEFFPRSADGLWRSIPVMGHAEIIESAHPDVPAGGRYFGFYPMAAEHVIAAETRPGGIVDAGEHRAKHAPTYRQFSPVPGAADIDAEDRAALLRGLFLTSYLVEDFLYDNANFGARSVLVTSASSKTSIALGYCLRERGTPSVALTSPRNIDAVRALGCYDNVIAYDNVATLDATVPSAVVDMAGDGAVLAAIHHHFGDNLKFSSLVGMTHHEAPQRTGDLPGAQPQFFFAPSQIEKRAADWGRGEFEARSAAAFAGFAEFSRGWLRIVRSTGPEAALKAYREVLEGRSEPSTGHIVTLAV